MSGLIKEEWDNEYSHQLISIDEAAGESEVDGIHVLAKARGPAFFPDELSGNNVFYPLSLWESVLEDSKFQKNLSNRLIFGTIGHSLPQIDDDAIRRGEFSHIVTDLFINSEGIGICEYLVLNTGPGRILNTLLRSKVGIRVSTKARGILKPFTYEGKSVKTPDPSVFKFVRVDFVLDPGFEEALPELVESLGDDYKLLRSDNIEEEIKMDDKEKISKILNIVESKLEDLTKKQDEISESQVQSLRSEIDNLSATMNSIQESLESYTKIGTQEEVSNIVENYNKIVADLGSYEKIEEALDTSSEAIASLKKRLELSQKDIQESLNIEEIQEELNKYREFGTLSQLTDLLESADSMAEEIMSAKIKEIAESSKVKPKFVRKLVDLGMTFDEIQEDLKDVADKDEEEEEDEEEKDVEESKKKLSSVKSYRQKSEEKVIDESKTRVGTSRASQLMARTFKR